MVGISVHSKHQTTKENISEILKGFQRDKKDSGFEIIVKGWDYPALIEAYEKAEKIARKEHLPVLVHVTEMTQPQGHSTWLSRKIQVERAVTMGKRLRLYRVI